MKTIRNVVAAAAMFLAGCGTGDQAPFTRGLQAPFVFNDSYRAFSGATVQVAPDRGILANDQLNGNTFLPFTTTTAQGGELAVAGDGSFVYTPPFGFVGTDTAQYSVEGNTATITFNVDRRAFFVNNAVAASGNGSQAQPFRTLQEALTAADQANDIVFIFAGDGTSTGLTLASDITLAQSGQSLIGEGAGLSTPEGTIVPAGNLPALANEVLLDKANTELAGVQITGVTNAVTVTAAATVRGNTFVNSGNDAVFIDEAAGTVQVIDNTMQEFAGAAVRVDYQTSNSDVELLIANNTATITAGNPFVFDMVFFTPSGTATVTLNNNTSTATGATYARGVGLFNGSGRNVIARLEDNNLGGQGAAGLNVANSGTGTTDVRVSQSQFTGTAVPFGVQVGLSGGQTTFVMEDSTVQGQSSFLQLTSSTNLLVGLRGNTFLDAAGTTPGLVTFDQATSMGPLGLDFVGNNLDQLRLNRVVGSQPFAVEQLSLLNTLNTFSNATPVVLFGDTITDAPDGSLNIP